MPSLSEDFLSSISLYNHDILLEIIIFKIRPRPFESLFVHIAHLYPQSTRDILRSLFQPPPSSNARRAKSIQNLYFLYLAQYRLSDMFEHQNTPRPISCHSRIQKSRPIFASRPLPIPVYFCRQPVFYAPFMVHNARPAFGSHALPTRSRFIWTVRFNQYSVYIKSRGE